MKKNLIVYNSSAGSGKTFTLVTEYLSLAFAASSPFYFRKILAITFTNKAAAEMKERVFQHLLLLQSSGTENEDRIKLAEIYTKKTGLPSAELREKAEKLYSALLHHYGDISICTIDSFMHRLVRSFTKDLGLVNDFEIETDVSLLLRQAIEKIVADAGKEKEITRLLLEFISDRTDEEKGWNIENDLLEFSKITGNEDSIEPLKKLSALTAHNFIGIKSKLLLTLKNTEEKVAEICRSAIHIISNNNLAAEDFFYGKSGAVNVFYKCLKGDLEEAYPGKRIKDVLEAGYWKPSGTGESKKNEIAAVSDELLRLLRQLIELYEKESSSYILQKILYRNIYHLSLLNEISKRCETIKNEKGIILIGDLNKMISEIIRNEPAPFIYERIGERYAHILIDEFQDTSEMQWRNFIPLIENSLANGNLNLLVGDVKQSIYRWRSGKAEQMLRLADMHNEKERFIATEEWEKTFFRNLQLVELDKNYRSKNEIIQFNNSFFKNFAEAEDRTTGKIYHSHHQELPADNPGGYAEIKIFEKNAENTESLHLSYLLKKINHSLDTGYHYGDIAILCRGKKEGAQVVAHLSASAVPVTSADSFLLGKSEAVKLVVAYLRICADPSAEKQKILFLDDYLWFTGNKTPLHEWIKKYTVENTNGKKTTAWKKLFASLGLESENESSWSYSLYQFTEDTIKMLGLDRADLFVSSFLDHLLHLSSAGTLTLHSFLSWWDDSGHEKAVAGAQNENAITVMTIHKSKGLQFPVVILPFAAWNLRKGKEKIWIDLVHGEAGNLPAGLLPVTSATIGTTRYEEKVQEELEKIKLDNINLLYVAFTRAEDRLYIFTEEKKSKTKKDEESMNSVDKFILDNIPVEMNAVPGEAKYFLGSDFSAAGKKPEKETVPVFDPSGIDLADWTTKLKVSFESAKKNTESASLFGNLLHELLAEINSQGEIKTVLDKMIKKGKLTGEQASELEIQAEKIFSHEFMQSLFSPGTVHKKEFEIMDKNGKIWRPDRLVIKDGRNILVDFKTGIKKEQHREQISMYAQLLAESGMKEPEKFLYYTSQNEVIKV